MSDRQGTYVRNALICIAVAANALCAGGVFAFPLISPALADHLHFTQPQITTIALAGMVGQYPFAALVGKVLDAHGPRACSFIAGILFSSGFGLFSREIATAPEDTTTPDEWVFRRLFVYFGMIGLGTVFSYFSTVFAATSTFPRYNGVASGTSMALFGSSPLVISMLATRYFGLSDGVIDVTHFLGFMSAVTAGTHLFGTFALRGASSKPEDIQDQPTIVVTDADEERNIAAPENNIPLEDEGSEETSALLVHNKRPRNAVEIIPVPEPQHGSVLDLLKDTYFWILAFIATVVFGSSEMVMANLASIFLSLPSKANITASSTIATQIQLLAIANTSSRLLVGPLSDLLSPVASYIEHHVFHHESHSTENDHANGVNAERDTRAVPTARYVYTFPRRQIVSRIAFLVAFNAILLLTFSFVDLFARSRESLWVMSVGVGFAYGGTFTILPGILISIWGAPNLGRNFGVISYAPFFGTSIFSYLFAFVLERHKPQSQSPAPGSGWSEILVNGGDGQCEGVECWRSTFGVCVGMLGVSLVGSVVLWRRWRGRV